MLSICPPATRYSMSRKSWQGFSLSLVGALAAAYGVAVCAEGGVDGPPGLIVSADFLATVRGFGPTDSCVPVPSGAQCGGVGSSTCPKDPNNRGACFPYNAGPPESGLGAGCGNCTGPVHSDCVGPPLPPGWTCSTTLVFCCFVNPCANTAAGCACVPPAGGGGVAKNTLMVCAQVAPPPAPPKGGEN